MADGSIFPGLSQRLPPSNLRAEQAVLGAILANNIALDRCKGLEPHHFADPVNGRVFLECRNRWQAGQLVDPVTLKNALENSGILHEVGGTAYLVQLLSSMIDLITVPAYAAAVRDAWVRRQVIDIGERAVNAAFGADPAVDGEGVVSDVVASLMDLAEGSLVDGASVWSTAVDDATNDADQAYATGKTDGLLTGIGTLDDLWGGLWPGALDMIAGRSGHGKTALGMQITEAIAGSLPAGQSVHIVSLEMTRKDLAVRMLASATSIPSDDIRQGKLTDARTLALIRARVELRALPMSVDDRPGMTLTDLCIGARIAVRRKGARLIVIDHRDLIKPDKAMARLSRTEQAQAITFALKVLAKSLNVPILLLVQTSRQGERREGPDAQRPRISDLAHAGEQDADNIVMVWRPELYFPDQPPPAPSNYSEEKQAAHREAWYKKKDEAKDKVEVILAKRRYGKTGMVKLRFDGPRTHFSMPGDETTSNLFGAGDIPSWV